MGEAKAEVERSKEKDVGGVAKLVGKCFDDCKVIEPTSNNGNDINTIVIIYRYNSLTTIKLIMFAIHFDEPSTPLSLVC